MRICYRMRLLPICFFFACSSKRQMDNLPPLPHYIPEIYLSMSSNEITWNQDTLYCRGKKYSGYAYTLYPGNDTASVFGYWQGLQEGVAKKWHANRRLAEYRTYVSGKKEGIHTAWWPNGGPKFMFAVSNDAYTVDLKEWNSEGVLVKWFHYKNGQEMGSQKLWWDDGSIRANYVIRNGKKYGLIGVKLCSNPYDSLNKK